mgnify:CR=1 FL=1
MSEYTTIYLRCKEILLLKYKEHPSYEEYQKLSKEDLMKVNREIDEYNKQVTKSLGCKLFYLSTTPSRELTMLPWSPSPSILTKGLLDEILYFYREEIDNYKNAIAKNKEDIDYIINQLKGLESKYGNELFDNTFKNKLKIRFGRIGSFSDNALIFLHNLEV